MWPQTPMQVTTPGVADYLGFTVTDASMSWVVSILGKVAKKIVPIVEF